MGNLEEVERIAAGIRCRVFAHVLKNGGGYLSQALSAADILATLYGSVLKLAPAEDEAMPGRFAGVPGPNNAAYRSGGRFNGPPAPDRDRFLFSPAHYALVLYATLIEVGRLNAAALDQFNVDGSTMEMIGAEHSPGVETTTGSLAQALSQACGIALGRKMRGQSGRTWVFMSDGEFQEGQTWEALAFAAFHQLGNLRAVIDVNGQQCDGAMADVANIEPLARRIRAFGCHAIEVDGHDLDSLAAAMNTSMDKPVVIVARTNPTFGLPLLEKRAPLLHYLRFTSDDERAEYESAYNDLQENA